MRILNSSIAYIVAGLALGLTSAIYGLDTFGLKPVAGAKGWQEWRLTASDRFAPYAVGHFLSEGRVPTPISAKFFMIDVDGDGNSLRADCAYTLEGTPVPSRWWSISIANNGSNGDGATLSAGKAVLESDGKLLATVSREPMPGNWLKLADSGAFQIVYAVSEPAANAQVELPLVKRSGC